MMRVVAEQAVADPTAMEHGIRSQMADRQQVPHTPTSPVPSMTIPDMASLCCALCSAGKARDCLRSSDTCAQHSRIISVGCRFLPHNHGKVNKIALMKMS